MALNKAGIKKGWQTESLPEARVMGEGTSLAFPFDTNADAHVMCSHFDARWQSADSEWRSNRLIRLCQRSQPYWTI
jgi:hypothetical protein